MLDTRHDVSPHHSHAQDHRVPVVLISGDGIGPEVADAATSVLSATFKGFEWIEAEAGAALMERGVASGVPKATLDEIERTGLVLKGPLATPIGHGGKSANVTLRKLYELYGNVRPIKPMPGLGGPFADRDINFVVVRENVEDLYAGIEHMQTPDVAQCLKLITRKGSEKIARLAFALARAEHRTSLCAVTKANIMKLTEGLFKDVVETTAREFPELDLDHMLVDNCAQQMVMRPEQFEVIVTTNMNGDILSDLGAGLIGGLGLTPSANVGDDVAIFEAVHGSAPDIAGRNVANPTALIRSGIMMLRHIGEGGAAQRLERALEDVYRAGTALTPDVAYDGIGVSTDAFRDAVLEALERVPETGGTAREKPGFGAVTRPVKRARPRQRVFDGADVFVEWHGDAAHLAKVIQTVLIDTPFSLSMISNRGTLVWPTIVGCPDTVEHWRCRLLVSPDAMSAEKHLPDVLAKLPDSVRWMHVEKLETCDGGPGYSMAQGQSCPQPKRRRP
ncbi:isocitrate/isopropylmalate family dehydrogenase [Tateyamaria armeniaca]|uniref:Isocitrate dehydrogenase [NADP] n=1 Tax=Tateyamaria armeniaca TaxID=2518930 RepID=A0ABW8UVW0_9RHOB